MEVNFNGSDPLAAAVMVMLDLEVNGAMVNLVQAHRKLAGQPQEGGPAGFRGVTRRDLGGGQPVATVRTLPG